MQAFGHKTLWLAPNGGQLRLMTNLGLGRGIKAIGWYGYGTHPNYGNDGVVNVSFLPRDDRYDVIKAVGIRLFGLRHILSRLFWHGGIPQKDMHFYVQFLTDKKKDINVCLHHQLELQRSSGGKSGHRFGAGS